MAKLSNFKNENEIKGASRDELEKKVEEYKSMNESELKSELFRQVAQQKREGKFNINALREMAQSVRGVVGEESYKNICALLGEIDD